jgi:hypothetical protein
MPTFAMLTSPSLGVSVEERDFSSAGDHLRVAHHKI